MDKNKIKIKIKSNQLFRKDIEYLALVEGTWEICRIFNFMPPFSTYVASWYREDPYPYAYAHIHIRANPMYD